MLKNYISYHSILGMLSKRYKLLIDNKGFIKNSKEICLTNSIDIEEYKDQYQKISLIYQNKEQFDFIRSNYNVTSFWKSTQIISYFNPNFFKLEGMTYREIRETKNKYNKCIRIENEIKDINEVIEFIQSWKNNRGSNKYGWQEHSGYDMNFFQQYYEIEKDNLYHTFIYDQNNNLLGYSIVEKNNVNNQLNYIIRKAHWNMRNICLYLDYITFEKIYNDHKEFYINWGCSSGTLLKYKSKFPIHNLETKYFIKIKS